MSISKNESEDMIRLFIAVELPSYIKEEVIRLQKNLMDKRVLIGNYPKPDAMHLTLKFIGNVEQNKIPLIQQALRSVESMRMHARISSLMFFGNFRFPKVVYVALDCPELQALVGAIDNNLKKLCVPEEREFKPHVTITRVKEMIDYQTFVDWIENTRVEPLSFDIESFMLMQSKLNSSGPIYIPIERYIFKS
jgi:2'-5' RNA ligase